MIDLNIVGKMDEVKLDQDNLIPFTDHIWICSRM